MTNTHVDLPEDLAGWLEVLRMVQTKRADLDELEAAAREKIQVALGDTVEGRLGGRPVVRWSYTAPARRFDAKQFKAEHPRLHEAYVKVGEPGRRFTLVDPSGDE